VNLLRKLLIFNIWKCLLEIILYVSFHFISSHFILFYFLVCHFISFCFISEVVQLNIINPTTAPIVKVFSRQFNAEVPPQMWYIVKCFYLLLSAYQIRRGYPARVFGDVLCKHYYVTNVQRVRSHCFLQTLHKSFFLLTSFCIFPVNYHYNPLLKFYIWGRK
jgi:hypothetical protein